MKRTLLSLIGLFICMMANAQFEVPKQDVAADFLSKKHLLVVIQPKNEDVREDVKDLIETSYTIDQEVEYVYSWDDLKQKVAADPEKYAIINVAYLSSWNNITNSLTYKGDIYAVGAMLPGKKKGRIDWVLPLLSPVGHSRFHIKYALTAISNYLPAIAKGKAPWNVNTDVAALKKKTLLIVEGALDKKTSLADAKAAYAGKLEVVPAERIVEVIEAQDPEYLVLVNEISSRTALVGYSIVDVSSYKLLANMAIGGVVIGLAAPGPDVSVSGRREKVEIAQWRASSTDVKDKTLKILSDAKIQAKYRKY